MFRMMIRPLYRMDNRGRLDEGDVPLAQREKLLGSTPEEGGDATKDKPAKDEHMGSGNRRKNTSGATMGGRHPDEGLDEESKNLGSEIEKSQ